MHPMRRIAPLLLAGGLTLLPTLALAHTELIASDPADGSTVSDAPDEVVLTFAGEVDEEATFTVFDPDGDEVGSGGLDLEVADRNVLRGQLEVATSGEYTVVWSVTGDDGHEVEGEVTFTYDPENQPTAPDTALPAGTGSPAALIGALLIVLAVTIPVRRALAVRS
ncbi:MAG TPA: copper resistance CopC family protein [Methylomirabilota bacterium]